ncbi:PAS domain-containing sensor histidine kinase [Kineococcus gypseus]|uniref:sensor histidine kinase n=1 Tax=Kineococcus gypseus TaxID=1637102 RepID=UPI003D7EE50F
MADLLQSETGLGPAEAEWLRLLVGDWQLISDLSFADLVLWVPSADRQHFVAVAHCRPTTGPTVHYDDVVGAVLERGRRPQVDTTFDEARSLRGRDPEWDDDVPVREETIPVVRDGVVLGVLARHTNLATSRTPSRLELNYVRCADDLTRMIAVGDFPQLSAPTGPRRGAPRVGDGMLRLDAEGVVTYASPNALSAFHRAGLIGELVGANLAEVASGLAASHLPVDESLPLVVTGRAPWRTDLETEAATLAMRAIPLTRREGGGAPARVAALLLVRDVSELRRRERELMTKDATIREVHHRVKNNLQTVAALLRLQSRRIGSEEGRSALQEAMRRVETIATVHETLSQGIDENVDFDQVLDRCLMMAAEVAMSNAERVRTVREGRFGELRQEDATALALVLTELVTNAVEHGFGSGRAGTVVVKVEHHGEDRLEVVVSDDGVGLPDDFQVGSSGLGTQIVRSLVAGELRGRMDFGASESGGTQVRLDLRVRRGTTPLGSVRTH